MFRLKSILSIFIFPFDRLGTYISVSKLLVIEFKCAYIDTLSVVYQGMSRVCSRGLRGSIDRTQVILLVLSVDFSKLLRIGIDLAAIAIK